MWKFNPNQLKTKLKVNIAITFPNSDVEVVSHAHNIVIQVNKYYLNKDNIKNKVPPINKIHNLNDVKNAFN